MPSLQLEVVERGAFEVIRKARSMKNSLQPISRVPPEIVSLIPDYLDRDMRVALTQVCRRWRSIFISRASLWTVIGCVSPDRTATYLQRSKTLPLKILALQRPRWGLNEDERYLQTSTSLQAFGQTAPHIGRFKSVALDLDGALDLVTFPAPTLENLAIRTYGNDMTPSWTTYDWSSRIREVLSHENLPSLSRLFLCGFRITLSEHHLPNITTLILVEVSGTSVVQLLKFFEHATLLRDVRLIETVRDHGDEPVERTVTLRCLRSLQVQMSPGHSTLLRFLRILPTALVTLRPQYNREDLPLGQFLANLTEEPNIGSVNLHFEHPWISIRFKGKSGDFYVTELNKRLEQSAALLSDIDNRWMSTAEKLTVTNCNDDHAEDPDVPLVNLRQILLLAPAVRTLRLNSCPVPLFIAGLSPDDTSGMVACPALEELILYTPSFDEVHQNAGELSKMAEQRASKLHTDLTITLAYQGRDPQAAEGVAVSQTGPGFCVKYQAEEEAPRWDAVPTEVDAAGGSWERWEPFC